MDMEWNDWIVLVCSVLGSFLALYYFFNEKISNNQSRIKISAKFIPNKELSDHCFELTIKMGKKRARIDKIGIIGKRKSGEFLQITNFVTPNLLLAHEVISFKISKYELKELLKMTHIVGKTIKFTVRDSEDNLYCSKKKIIDK